MKAILVGQLYISGETISKPLDKRLRLYRDNGISMIINLWDKGYDDSLPPWIRFLHVPISDGRIRPWITDVERAADEGARHITDERGTVLAQCYGGHNRSGLMAALIARRVLGLSGEAALALIQQRRSTALVNPHFAAYLRGLT